MSADRPLRIGKNSGYWRHLAACVVVFIACGQLMANTTLTSVSLQDAQISLDGVPDEPVWAQLPVYHNLRVTEPDTLESPEFATQVRMFYTAKGLYVSAVMQQPSESLVRRLSNRDQLLNRDSFSVTLDTSGEGLYGYWFELSLGGSKADGKLAPERSFTRQWDGAWSGETAVVDNGWSAELFIPWSILSMPNIEAQRRLNFWLQRKVAHANEEYSWPALPRSKPRFMTALAPMAVSGVNPRQQWAVFPYAATRHDAIKDTSKTTAGLDVFWRPSSNLQLTASANPDFGAVESDDVVVNLTAFETFFPEKRLFFLEGTEVFVTSPRATPTSVSLRSQGGRQPPQLFNLEPTTLLNTRRIGGAARHLDVPDDVDVAGVELSRPTELFGAVKAVGQAGSLRYGILTAMEKNVEIDGTHVTSGSPVQLTTDGRNFGVLRALYEDTQGESRRSIGWMGTVTQYPNRDDAVVQGIDTHWLSANGRWSWDTQFVGSKTDEATGYGLWTDIGWTPQQGMSHRLAVDLLDDDVDLSDLGYLRRNDSISFRYSFFTTESQGLSPHLQRRNRGIFMSSGTNTDGELARGYLGAFTTLVFSSNSELRAEIDWLPGHYDDRTSRGNGSYKVKDGYFFSLGYGTDASRPFSSSLQLGSRSEDLGDPMYFVDLGFTWVPSHQFSLNLDLRWKKRNNWLVHQSAGEMSGFDAIDLAPSMSMDFFVSAKQQLRLTLQWVGIQAKEQARYRVPLSSGNLIKESDDHPNDADFTISRLAAQLRYRWEIGPLSDLFIVYTRGSNLENQVQADFDKLLVDAFNDPIVDNVIVKLRYRFGS